MADTQSVIEAENGTLTESKESRTFTQEEVNSIVEGRLKKESAKYSDYEELKAKASKFDEMEEANKTELQKATEKADALQKQIDAMTKSNEVRDIREKVSSETGIPISLLTSDSEDGCRSQAEAILNFANANRPTYPSVKDGGEVTNTTATKTTGEQFSEWLNNQLT